MRPLTNRLRDAAKATGVARDVVEVDYAISYILAGIVAQPALRETLVFKGGTALKKLFFGNYRFSEDLDFSTRNAPQSDELDALLRTAKDASKTLLHPYGNVDVSLERYAEREPHPDGQEAFIYRARFPWQREALCRIKIEITHVEQVVLDPHSRRLIHGYEEDLSVDVPCLRLEEIVAEKMRSLLQTRKKFEQGTNRPRPRDYYDLWRVLSQFGTALDATIMERLLPLKCEFRAVSYRSVNDFFDDTILGEAHRYWTPLLGRLVPDLPEFEQVISQLRALIPTHFPGLAAG